MKISEIFSSIDGEGKRAGQLVTFIRTVGCNIACGYCDTKYSWEKNKECTYQELTLDEILKTCDSHGWGRVTLTGGEPLIANGVEDLVELLVDNGYEVNIETNGTIDPYKVLYPKTVARNNLFFTMDYKTITSKYNNRMNIDAFKHLQAKDIVKCVVGTKEDIVDSVRFVNSVYRNFSEGVNVPQLYLSPIFGMIEPAEIVEIMKEMELDDWKIQLQMHKYIWDKDKRGV